MMIRSAYEKENEISIKYTRWKLDPLKSAFNIFMQQKRIKYIYIYIALRV